MYNNFGWLLSHVCVFVFRARRPTFTWKRMVLAAPATGAPAPVAAAEARAGHAATHLAAAKSHRATPPTVHAPVLAPRSCPTAVCLQAGEGIVTLLKKFCQLTWEYFLSSSLGVPSPVPHWLPFLFLFFIFMIYRADESGHPHALPSLMVFFHLYFFTMLSFCE